MKASSGEEPDDPGRKSGRRGGAVPEQRGHAGLGDDAGRVIMSAAADGIVAVDERGTIRYCNTAAAELFARPAGDLVGSRFGFPIVAGQPTEIDLMQPGGEALVVDMRVTTTTVEGERLHVAMLRDITRRRQAEHELAAALDRQNVVVGVAAHELHNPLFAISVLAEVLRDRSDALSEVQRREIIDRIAERAARLQSLVHKLLATSRIDAQAPPAAVEPVPVLEFLLERLPDLRERSRDVHITCDPELAVLADRGELAEMVGNYLENAFAYGSPPVEVEATGQAGSVEVRVYDRGPGVPEAFVPDLFERFTRARQVHADTEGTGLGLWIVRNLAAANGGHAWYEPGKHGGACFCLRLPRPHR